MMGGGLEENGADAEKSSSVRCVECGHFQYFANAKGHNSPHALGECIAKPWDGSPGQWPMLSHPCKMFGRKASEAVPASKSTT